jgi:hypothetical protein
MQPDVTTPDTLNYVIYHDYCNDGTGSAVVIWDYLLRRFGVEYLEKIIFKPMSYQFVQNNEELLTEELKGKNLVLCDFSFKKNLIEKVMSRVNSFLIIDHHVTAKEDLIELDPKYKIFDMNHSGASLTWKWIATYEKQQNWEDPNNYSNAPLFIKYIEDRDLYLNQMQNIFEFNLGINSIKRTIENYHLYYKNDSAVQELINIGIPLYRQMIESVDYLIETSTRFVVQNIKGTHYVIAYYQGFSTDSFSDIGNTLLRRYSFIDFAAIVSRSEEVLENGSSDKNVKFSLRSLDTRTDVRKIAEIWGGGGHRNAAGVALSLSDPDSPYLRGHGYDYDLFPCEVINRDVLNELNENQTFDPIKNSNVLAYLSRINLLANTSINEIEYLVCDIKSNYYLCGVVRIDCPEPDYFYSSEWGTYLLQTHSILDFVIFIFTLGETHKFIIKGRENQNSKEKSLSLINLSYELNSNTSRDLVYGSLSEITYQYLKKERGKYLYRVKNFENNAFLDNIKYSSNLGFFTYDDKNGFPLRIVHSNVLPLITMLNSATTNVSLYEKKIIDDDQYEYEVTNSEGKINYTIFNLPDDDKEYQLLNLILNDIKIHRYLCTKYSSSMIYVTKEKLCEVVKYDDPNKMPMYKYCMYYNTLFSQYEIERIDEENETAEKKYGIDAQKEIKKDAVMMNLMSMFHSIVNQSDINYLEFISTANFDDLFARTLKFNTLQPLDENMKYADESGTQDLVIDWEHDQEDNELD